MPVKSVTLIQRFNPRYNSKDNEGNEYTYFVDKAKNTVLPKVNTYITEDEVKSLIESEVEVNIKGE